MKCMILPARHGVVPCRWEISLWHCCSCAHGSLFPSGVFTAPWAFPWFCPPLKIPCCLSWKCFVVVYGNFIWMVLFRILLLFTSVPSKHPFPLSGLETWRPQAMGKWQTWIPWNLRWYSGRKYGFALWSKPQTGFGLGGGCEQQSCCFPSKFWNSKCTVCILKQACGKAKYQLPCNISNNMIQASFAGKLFWH